MMNSRIPNIARVLLGIAIVTLIGWWMFGMYRDQFNGTRNISRADYNAALQRWHDKGASTYEEVVEMKGDGFCTACGEYTLRVDTVPDKITVLAYTPKSTGHPLSEGLYTQDQILHHYTVAALFTRVDGMLDEPLRCDNPPVPVLFDYDIAFNGALGYPEHLNYTSRPHSTLECGGMESFISVKSVKIIK
jgi:hypothetical protein